ncbi:hypothetical protein RQP46_010612 [Phenoliferia psychrophenolica]
MILPTLRSALPRSCVTSTIGVTARRSLGTTTKFTDDKTTAPAHQPAKGAEKKSTVDTDYKGGKVTAGSKPPAPAATGESKVNLQSDPDYRKPTFDVYEGTTAAPQKSGLHAVRGVEG